MVMIVSMDWFDIGTSPESMVSPESWDFHVFFRKFIPAPRCEFGRALV